MNNKPIHWLVFSPSSFSLSVSFDQLSATFTQIRMYTFFPSNNSKSCLALIEICFKMVEENDIIELEINDNSTLGDEFCATFGFPLMARKFLKESL